MSKVKSLLIVALATVGATLASSCFAQGFSTGDPVPPIVQGCGGCQGQANFSNGAYQSAFNDGCSKPGCGCRGSRGGGGQFGGSGQFMSEMKARHAQLSELHARIEARNDAWPKPFDCADRQLYFSIWDPMIDQGFEEQCVLTSMHFEADTHELNKIGRHAVAGIMQNMPENRKTVFIHRDTNTQINEARRAQVEDTIRTFYSQSTAANVAYSNKLPVTTSGVKAELTQQAWLGAQAIPAIPVNVGGDVNSAVGGN